MSLARTMEPAKVIKTSPMIAFLRLFNLSTMALLMISKRWMLAKASTTARVQYRVARVGQLK